MPESTTQINVKHVVEIDTLFLLINRIHYLKGLKMLRIKFNGKRVSLEEWPLKMTNINRCNWRPGKELSWDQAKTGRPQSIFKTRNIDFTLYLVL